MSKVGLGRVGAVSLATMLAFTSIGVVVQAGTAAAAPVVVPLGAPAPVAPALTTSGFGTAQQQTVPVKPLNGQLTLVAGGADVTFINTDAGFYSVDQGSGTLLLVPNLGFSGVAPAVTYKITNATAQSASNTYIATVNKPAGPTATPLSSTRGRGAGFQYASADIPQFDRAFFIVNGQQVTSVDEPGMGTYGIQSGDGTSIDFNALECFVGTVPTVAYQVEDSYDQTANSTYTAHVTNGPVPTSSPLTSTGVGPNAQTATAPLPGCNATAHLVASGNTLVTSVTRTGVGTFSIVPATGVITFTPVAGYSGTPAPVSYRIVSAQSQSSEDSTYTPTVTTPAPPTASALTSTGLGTALQSQTTPVPADGNLALIDTDLNPVGAVTVAGGTYTANPATGVITFAPVPGFLGAAEPVTFRVTDSFNQTASATYTATVTMPAAPAVSPAASSGAQGNAQQRTITIPPGGSITLLNGTTPATTVTIAGQGTYSLNTTTGVITFTPLAAFSGVPGPVSFQVTDAYGQSVRSTYAPAVTAAILTGPGISIPAVVVPAVPVTATVSSDGGAIPTSVPAGTGGPNSLTRSAGSVYSLPLGLVGLVLVGAGVTTTRRRRRFASR